LFILGLQDAINIHDSASPANICRFTVLHYRYEALRQRYISVSIASAAQVEIALYVCRSRGLIVVSEFQGTNFVANTCVFTAKITAFSMDWLHISFLTKLTIGRPILLPFVDR